MPTRTVKVFMKKNHQCKAVHGYLPSTQGKFSDVYPWVKVNVGNRKAVYPWVKVKVGKGVISG